MRHFHLVKTNFKNIAPIWMKDLFCTLYILVVKFSLTERCPSPTSSFGFPPTQSTQKPLYKESIHVNDAHSKENNPLWLFLSFVQTSGSRAKKREQLFSSEGPGKKWKRGKVPLHVFFPGMTTMRWIINYNLQSFPLKQTPETREVATCKQADKHHNKFGSDLQLHIHSNEPHPTRVGRYCIPHFQETFAA